MRPPRDWSQSEGYPRPHLPWQCGLSDEGPPCAAGPNAGGQCPAAAACHPQRAGDRWVCNRNALRGGPCVPGPGPDGHCGVVHRCTPYRSLRSRRGRFALGWLAAALGAAAMALSGDWRNELIVPGALSTHHAHLAQGANANQRCAQCHASADLSLLQWGKRLTGAATNVPSQSTLCLNCHNVTIDQEHALAAHTMPWERLKSPTSGQGRRDPAAPTACAACHREHQGRDHRLAEMTNEACQACHSETYSSFAEGHPEFGSWPYARRTRIAFSHSAHSLKHFPAEHRSFDCAACHAADATGDRQLTGSYEATCAACHDKALQTTLAGGVSLLSLPTLDTEALADAGFELKSWPDEADGDFDGALPVWTRLLLLSDEKAAAALEALGSNFDFFDVDPESRTQVDHAGAVAQGLRALIDELASRGSEAVKERLTAISGRPASADDVTAISVGLSAAASTCRDAWFTTDAAGGEVGAAPDAAAGWISDADRLSLRREVKGHADPWLRGWLDVLAQAATGPQAAIAEPLLREAMRPTAAGQCGACHTVERTSAGTLAIQWRGAAPFTGSKAANALTHFSHKSHLVQAQLRDCKTCHVPVAEIPPAGDSATFDPSQFVADFAPVRKSDCAACHTQSAAGDRCTQCHSYHAGKPSGLTLLPSAAHAVK